ncbi:hypothetical protein OAN22_01835 [Alphaproteobacteria bacterium]|nr:hypothetical protein [Alphaproteobacteria bacterium]
MTKNLKKLSFLKAPLLVIILFGAAITSSAAVAGGGHGHGHHMHNPCKKACHNTFKKCKEDCKKGPEGKDCKKSCRKDKKACKKACPKEQISDAGSSDAS